MCLDVAVEPESTSNAILSPRKKVEGKMRRRGVKRKQKKETRDVNCMLWWGKQGSTGS